jgi:glycerol-3-phosphate dehydrogenase subunit C
MKEGSLEAPTRHAIAWQDESFYDEALLDTELRRVFDICHGCRRCFNLCDSFPNLFDLVDASPDEVEGLSSEQFAPVIDACTLCDMCFMTKCPYVPPHTFDLDFPHLMLRARSIEHRKGETRFADKLLAETDRNGKIGSGLSGLANWATKDGGAARGALQATLGIDKRAHLPKFAQTPMTLKAAAGVPAANPDAPAFGRKAVLYASCYGEFNDQTPGEAALKVLAHNGIALRVEHPGCCGMPKFENGDLAAVAGAAGRVAASFAPLIDAGYDIVPLTSSCALMLKFEWPLLMPGHAGIAKLAQATYDLSEFVVDMARKSGLMPIEPMPVGIAVHFACHARAQNMGAKAIEMLRLIPEARPQIVERCSGHGGKWGIFKENFDAAIKVGKPAARAIEKANADYVVSECPLAGPHLMQVLEAINAKMIPTRIGHPIEVLAKAYGL